MLYIVSYAYIFFFRYLNKFVTLWRIYPGIYSCISRNETALPSFLPDAARMAQFVGGEIQALYNMYSENTRCDLYPILKRQKAGQALNLDLLAIRCLSTESSSMPLLILFEICKIEVPQMNEKSKTASHWIHGSYRTLRRNIPFSGVKEDSITQKALSQMGCHHSESTPLLVDLRAPTIPQGEKMRYL